MLGKTWECPATSHDLRQSFNIDHANGPRFLNISDALARLSFHILSDNRQIQQSLNKKLRNLFMMTVLSFFLCGINFGLVGTPLTELT
jgi:hypothetical protein